MGLLQIFIIAITVGLNALDGFDVLSISFASPGIKQGWGLDHTGLGFVLAMELIGMAIGSVSLGWVADTIGRRKIMLGCLATMAAGMFMVANAGNIFQLSVWRIVTGIGIGGLLAAITAITAEFSNLKNRALCISIMAIGYPLGGVIGGEIAGRLLMHYDWRAIFYFGAAATTIFIPIYYFVVPESVHWLVRKQPAGALDKVNATLKRLGHKTVAALPEITDEVRKKSFGDLFAPGLRRTTIIITVAYFLQITTYYFILKWTPQVVVDMDFTAVSGANMLKFANFGGLVGGIIFGFLTLRIVVKKLTMATLTLSAVFITLLGYATDLNYFTFVVIFCGFFGNAGIIGMYALFPTAFPTHVRASGTGFVLSLGRGGAYLSPIIVGYMFDRGLSLPTVTMLISIGALIGAGVLMFLKLEKKAA
jgi:benzoate transport